MKTRRAHILALLTAVALVAALEWWVYCPPGGTMASSPGVPVPCWHKEPIQPQACLGGVPWPQNYAEGR